MPDGGRLVGSVRFRITAAVTVLFALALSVAAVLLVARVESVLTADVFARDLRALDQFRTELTAGRRPGTLNPPRAVQRLGTQFQVIDPRGDVVSSSPGAPSTPLVVIPTVVDDAQPRPTMPDGQPVPTRPDGQPVPTLADGRPVPIGPNGAGRPGAQQPGAQLPGAQQPGGPPSTAPPPAADPPEGLRPSTTLVTPEDDGSGVVGADLAVTVIPLPLPEGVFHLVAASSLDGVDATVSTLSRTLWLAIPLLVALIGITAWLLTGRALRPVEGITRRVEEISASTLHERVPVPAARDEVAHLATTMNAMLERLEDASVRQRRFVSDASHELRTPVASIRTGLEVALLHPGAADWEAVARDALVEDERLERIVADLLLLARLDERPELLDAQRVDLDLDDVVRAEAARVRPGAVTVVVTACAPARVAGRPEELDRLVAHLVDNAVRHARSRVEVALHALPAEAGGPGGSGARPPLAQVVVADDGPGIPPADREAVFERFGRLDEGRARDAGGAGLGLAVVRRIAEHHGGGVQVTDGPLGGACFVVDLPRREA